MSKLSEIETNKIKKEILNILINKYPKEIALIMIDKSNFIQLLRKNPEYMLHYDLEYWASYIENKDNLIV